MHGAALMSASMAGFVLNDTALKFGGPNLGLFQAIFIRGLFAIAMMAILAYALGAFSNLPRTRGLRLIVTCPRNFPHFDVEFSQPFKRANKCDRVVLNLNRFSEVVLFFWTALRLS